MVDGTLALSVHQRELEFNGFMIAAQLLPTVQYVFSGTSAVAIGPFVGLGGGIVLQPDLSGDNRFSKITSLRFGVDLMFRSAIGVSAVITKSWISQEFDSYYWYDDYDRGMSRQKKIGFDQFGITAIFQL